MIWTYSILSVGLVCVGMCVIVSLLDSKRVFMKFLKYIGVRVFHFHSCIYTQKSMCLGVKMMYVSCNRKHGAKTRYKYTSVLTEIQQDLDV